MNANNYAKWVADLMKADGVTPEQVTPEMAVAYFCALKRKIDAIQTAYLYRTGARQAMQEHVLTVMSPVPAQ